MLEKKLRYDFIEKHSRNCTPEELYRNFLHYYDNYMGGDSHTQVQLFSDCLWYIKKLVSRTRPDKLIKFILAKENMPYEKSYVAYLYIDLISMIARIYESYEAYEMAVCWAKKGLNLIEYFHPVEAAFSKEYIIKHSKPYLDCSELFQKYKEYLDKTFCSNMIFDWEDEFYFPANSANNNS
jgi:hypothetical protein